LDRLQSGEELVFADAKFHKTRGENLLCDHGQSKSHVKAVGAHFEKICHALRGIEKHLNRGLTRERRAAALFIKLRHPERSEGSPVISGHGAPGAIQRAEK
jgi:hypothetical protein